MSDALLQTTCEQIVTVVAEAIGGETARDVQGVHIPDGTEVGRQVTIDATEKDGPMNRCRLSFLNPDIAPAHEVVRIEFEHDKEGKFGVHRVYSVQSVRRQGGRAVLLENFLADRPEAVREEDFRPILSETYARETVLKTLNDWIRYRAWQQRQGA